MANNEKLRQLGLDKAAFLGLLVLGLIWAEFITFSRSDFKLSEPLAIKGTGIEVSIPSGDGWKRLSNNFKYEDNEFNLVCQMQIGNDSLILAQWRYFTLPLEKTPSERFKIKANSLSGSVKSEGSGKFGDFTFDYAKVVSEKTPAVLFCGTTVLPDGRTITLEVAQRGQGVDLAEKIFKSLLASVKYHPDNPVVNGAELLKKLKASLPAMLSRQGYQNYYRIKDAHGTIVGFTTDTIISPADSNADSAVFAAGLLFVSPAFSAFAEQSLFYSDISISRFDWTIKHGNLLTNRQQPTQISLDGSKVLTVQKQNTVEKVHSTDTMIPDIFLDLTVAEFLKSDFDTVMLEVILSDGKIAPVIFSRINSPETSVLPAESAAGVELFGSNTVYQKMYFDGEGKLLSADIQGSLSYRIERTTKTAILADFPQWLEKIQQIEQYQLKKNSRPK